MGVPEGKREIWNALEHRSLVDKPGRDVDALAVNAEIDTAEELHSKPGCANDDVCRQLLA